MANLTRQGFDVYMVEWIPPARADSWRGFDAYVNQDLGDTMRAVQNLTGAPKVNLLGYCFGGLLTLLYAALHPDDVKNLITLTTPFDTAVDDNPLFNLENRFSGQTVDLVTSVYGNCPAWFIRGLFTATAVVHHAVDKYVALYRNKEKEDYAEFFDLFEQWMAGDVPLAGRIFREVTRDFFQKNLLKNGEFNVGGERVELANIACPLLNAIGDFDDVVFPASSLPLIDFVGSEDKRNLTFPAGHIGMVVSGCGAKAILAAGGRVARRAGLRRPGRAANSAPLCAKCQPCASFSICSRSRIAWSPTCRCSCVANSSSRMAFSSAW